MLIEFSHPTLEGLIVPIFKVAVAILVSLLPLNALRVLGYRLFFGYRIVGSNIGFGTIIAVDGATITNTRIGFFNLFIGPLRLTIGEGASIRNRNSFVCGYWVLREENRKMNYTRTLEIGASTLITSNHYFDIAGTFKLGERSWVAGIGSQFWTHGVGVRDRDIEIGSDCYLGSAVRFAPGSFIGDNVLVAMGSVVSGKLEANDALVGGVPAKVLKENYDWKSQNE
jgi:acetyltransferase-like isoleucine patch superfamily enzyme